MEGMPLHSYTVTQRTTKEMSSEAFSSLGPSVLPYTKII